MKKFIHKGIIYLSSTINAIILISLISLISVIGTFVNTYSIFKSWWYITLLLLLIVSLFVCSSKRFAYLFKVRAYRNSSNLKLKTNIKIPVSASENVLTQIKKTLMMKRYIIYELENNLVAEKHHFSRWGAFIIHIGIIVMALGAISRIVPGWYIHDYVWLKEGEEIKIPQTNYFVKNTRFFIENYENGIPKNYQTDIQLADQKTGAKTSYSVQVNKPLKINKFSILQSDYQKTFKEINITVKNKQSQRISGNITIDLYNLKKEIALQEPYVLVIKEYFPDLALDNNNKPISKTPFPNNPAFVFQVKDIQIEQLSDSQWFILRNFTDPSLGQNDFSIDMNYYKDEFISGLIIYKDVGKPSVFAGLLISVVGLFIALYFQHKKLWITYTPKEILIEARTNRNIEGLKLELVFITETFKEKIENDKLASNFL